MPDKRVRSRSAATTSLRVSELHVPGYRESKKQFILKEEDVLGKPPLRETSFTDADYSSVIPYKDGNLLHKTNGYIFTEEECQMMIDEAEQAADEMGWTTKRHGNYPTTDLPIAELPQTLNFLRGKNQPDLIWQLPSKASHRPTIPTLGETVTSSRSTNADPHLTLTQSYPTKFTIAILFFMLLTFVLTDANAATYPIGFVLTFHYDR